MSLGLYLCDEYPNTCESRIQKIAIARFHPISSAGPKALQHGVVVLALRGQLRVGFVYG